MDSLTVVFASPSPHLLFAISGLKSKLLFSHMEIIVEPTMDSLTVVFASPSPHLLFAISLCFNGKDLLHSLPGAHVFTSFLECVTSSSLQLNHLHFVLSPFSIAAKPGSYCKLAPM